jgi:hypothetical protein
LLLAGLVPAIHAFLAVDRVAFEDVGGRNKSGQGIVGCIECVSDDLLRLTGQPWVEAGELLEFRKALLCLWR